MLISIGVNRLESMRLSLPPISGRNRLAVSDGDGNGSKERNFLEGVATSRIGARLHPEMAKGASRRFGRGGRLLHLSDWDSIGR